MQLGMIGLGRMGANMVRRLMRDGHEGVAFDLNPDSVKALAGEGAVGAESMEDFVGKLERPRCNHRVRFLLGISMPMQTMVSAACMVSSAVVPRSTMER